MRGIEQLLRLLNDSMYHQDESILRALAGITHREAVWQHPAYAEEEQRPGMPAPGTIAWQVAHLTHSAWHYAAILRQRPVHTEPRTPPPETEDIAELLAELERAHAELVHVTVAISDTALAETCARGMAVEEFLRMAIRHNTWHAGQIRLLRRLWQHGANATGLSR